MRRSSERRGSAPFPAQNLAATTFAVMTVAAMIVGCGGEAKVETAETEALEAPAVVAGGRTYVIDRESSKVDFLMEAPLEHIHGVANRSVEGELSIDFDDLKRSRGLVRADLLALELFQQRRPSPGASLGTEAKNEKQNEHMRTWLQISSDAPAAMREDHRWAALRINDVKEVNEAQAAAGTTSVRERVVNATLDAELRLHGRTTRHELKVQLRFTLNDAGEPQSLAVKTLEPLSVGLEEHDVRPRSAFDTLAEKTLAALGEKVAKAAPVHVALEARPR